jgi:hypothetical protein
MRDMAGALISDLVQGALWLPKRRQSLEGKLDDIETVGMHRRENWVHVTN